MFWVAFFLVKTSFDESILKRFTFYGIIVQIIMFGLLLASGYAISTNRAESSRFVNLQEGTKDSDGVFGLADAFLSLFFFGLNSVIGFNRLKKVAAKCSVFEFTTSIFSI